MATKSKKSIAGAGIALSNDNRWRVESDLNTLIEAEKIKGDAKRFSAVQALAKERMMDAAKVASEEAGED